MAVSATDATANADAGRRAAALDAYDSLNYQQLQMLLGSGDSGSITKMASRWEDAKSQLARRTTALKDALDHLEKAWEGEAAQRLRLQDEGAAAHLRRRPHERL